MAHYNQDWDDLGRSIQDLIDRAVNSQDYQKLNQTVHQVVDRAVGAGSEAVRRAVDGSSRRGPNAAGGAANPAAGAENKKLPVLYGSTREKTAKSILKALGGGLLAFFSFAVLSVRLMYDLFIVGMLSRPIILSLLGLGAGVWLIYSGVRGLGQVRRCKIYERILGQKTHCALDKLARGVGKNVNYVRKELRQLIKEGFFLEGHLDKDETCLITSDETYQYYEQSRLALEERQRQEASAKARESSAPRDPRLQEVLDRGNAFIAEIRRCNDAIPGEEISEKISRMELIVQRIFERAEAHPEIVPDLKKLMDYYLPMTVKLLNAYADMDAQPIQGETIQSSKREIEATLDTLNLAFEKLLDSVFADTAMDVSSDISVLNTLLAQEGLTEDEFAKMKKQQK